MIMSLVITVLFQNYCDSVKDIFPKFDKKVIELIKEDSNITHINSGTVARNLLLGKFFFIFNRNQFWSNCRSSGPLEEYNLQ